MKKAILLIFILFQITLVVKSQTGFRHGYIIKNNGDTLNGYVYYSLDVKFKNTCCFKRFEIAKEINYGPSELKGYGFRNGRYFNSRKIGNRKTFYECLVQGPISLYILPGKPDHLYIDHAATGFIKLVKGYNQFKSGERFNNFRETLSWLLNQSGLVSATVNSAEYNADSILALLRKSSVESMSFQAYNRTPGLSFLKDYSLTSVNSRLRFGVATGYQFLQIDIPGNSYFKYFDKADYNTSYRPAIGIFLNYKLSKRSDLVSFDVSYLYYSDTYYGYAEYKNTWNYRDDFLFKISAIQVPLSLKFTFGKQRLHPYIRAGIYRSFVLNSSYSHVSDVIRGDEIYTEIKSDFTLGHDSGIQGAAGVEIELGNSRLIGLEAGYLSGHHELKGKSNSHSTKMKTNTISFLLRLYL